MDSAGCIASRGSSCVSVRHAKESAPTPSDTPSCGRLWRRGNHTRPDHPPRLPNGGTDEPERTQGLAQMGEAPSPSNECASSRSVYGSQDAQGTACSTGHANSKALHPPLPRRNDTRGTEKGNPSRSAVGNAIVLSNPRGFLPHRPKAAPVSGVQGLRISASLREVVGVHEERLADGESCGQQY